LRQESRAVARKPRDAAAVLFGLKFADKSATTFTTSLRVSHSKSRVWSRWKGDKALSNTI